MTFRICALCAFVLTTACATSRPAAPPIAKRVPHSVTVHGDTREDEYAWLRNRSDPDVLAYLEAETAYAKSFMRAEAGLQERLYQELLGRIQQTSASVPYRKGDHLYYSRTEEGRPYAIHCRKRVEPEGPEEVLLDLNALAEGHRFFRIKAFAVSDDGNLLAYSVDTSGGRDYTLYLKDLRTGALLPEHREHVDDVAWAADNRTLLYATEDAAKRSHRVWRHELGAKEDTLVYEDADEHFNVYVWRSRSGEYLFIKSRGRDTGEVRVLPAGEPRSVPRVILPREEGHQYSVDHRGGLFYIRTNSGAPHFRLVATPVDATGRENWTELLPHRESVMLEDVQLFARHLVISEREGGLQVFTVMDLTTGQRHRITFPEAFYEVELDRNEQWNTSRLRLRYESPVTPASTFDYDMTTRERVLLQQQQVPGYEPSRYTTERLFVMAADGARIPVSLVYRKGLRRDGSAPMYLKGYGAYGSTPSLGFFSNDVSMLERGIVVATAHVRGGGDLGETWHDAGRLHRKMNTFTDFISVAEALIARGYTSKERLAIWGGSAGGLLVGTVLNLRPDLFRVALLHFPFVDVLNTMLDPSLALTVPEYEEWGNPTKPEDYAVIKQYCPYTNVKAQPYPAVMVMAALNDSQVMYWQPAKWVARLRAMKTDTRPLLLHMDLDAGHSGPSDRYAFLREVAFTFAFVFTELGLEQ
ncbi:S9 family peptidase [Pyxidicoccus parkwayensis]|uniref:S9 family peptidase n=1 Tax=Pyxidicoccus parkwayensis TaxID=2813578 RepID=A0ABX7P2P6_9BACT|nr:S9 family peptidase [Pyxidicoccus parkwaysis]QSQ24737.1 S9 family peptidase [Pyxidicoccus parkwaysis]